MQEISLKVDAVCAGKRLDIFIFSKLEERGISISREVIKKLILNGDIILNGEKSSPSQKTKEGDIIVGAVCKPPAYEIQPQNIPVNIVYEDDDVIVINKQAGLVVHPAVGNLDNTLVNGLLFLGKILSNVDPKRPGIVHRLDKETSGLMLVAKNNQAHYFFVKQFSRHLVQRHYVAIVQEEVPFDEGVIDASIGKHPRDFRKMTVGVSREKKEALTRYKVIKRTKNWSFLELIPQTGRTHQLRVHLASIGHPIIGDTKYGKTKNDGRLFLHAKTIKFIHPRTKEEMEFLSDIPKEFKEFISNSS